MGRILEQYAKWVTIVSSDPMWKCQWSASRNMSLGAFVPSKISLRINASSLMIALILTGGGVKTDRFYRAANTLEVRSR